MIQQLKGTKGTKDRAGLRSLTFAYLLEDTTAEAALEARVALPTSLTEVGRSLSDWEGSDSAFVLNITCEGMASEEDSEEDMEYTLDGELSEEPIEAHPAIDRLMQLYGGTKGDDGRVQFPEKLPSGKSGSGTGLGSRKSSGDANPMFGITSYPRQAIVATRRRLVKSLPASVWTAVGRITKSLPTGFDEPGNRSWIQMPPVARKRGNRWDLTERWKDVDSDKGAAELAALIKR